MTAQKKIKVAIDGPAGSGKSTVAQAIASRLDLKYLDTGAMYRAITLKLLREKTELSDLDAVDKVVAQTELFLDDSKHVYLDGEDVTAEIRQRHVNDMVSPVSALSVVRRRLVLMQQKIAETADGIVMEGRDIASCVLPDADYKFYLDASLSERARRRTAEQLEKGIGASAEIVATEINNRDRVDSTREDSPLAVMPGVIVVDTTAMPFEMVVDHLMAIIRQDL